MKMKIAVAGLLALLAAATFVGQAAAQCGTGPMITATNDNQWAFETSYNVATRESALNSVMTAGGVIELFCAPFLDLIPGDPTKEYTWVLTGTSGGTLTEPNGLGSKHTTIYNGVTFAIYEGSPENVPALPIPNYPNAQVPANYQDGTAILTGTMTGFTVIQLRPTSSGAFSSSVNAQYAFNGGTLYNRVGNGVSTFTGTWCPAGTTGCIGGTTGYSSRPKPKWDTPATTAIRSSGTWGAIKQIYR